MTITHVTAGLTVRECVKRIAAGELTSEQLVNDCFTVIEASESELKAWVSLDKDLALSQARAMDDMRRQGRSLGILHGIPVGIKDNINTTAMPTQHGSAIYADNHPDRDATVIEKLREAGAVILGKTVCTEFAFMHPAETHNPHNPAYSPGGSSSGSAAAVAAGHVPLALGTQTNGSVVRPASFCGCYGFKPSLGVISRQGVFQTSDTLDQLGVFARDAGDIALVTDALKGFDIADTCSQSTPKPRYLEGFLSEVPVPPSLAWIDLPYSDGYSSSLKEGVEELLDALGTQVDRVAAPQSFAALVKCHKRIYDYEIYRCLQNEREQHFDKLSDTVKTVMDSAAQVSEESYQEALEIRTAARAWFVEFYNDYDAILTPSALGEAPKYGQGTGDPICCTIWTLCGLPSISIPLLSGVDDMPIGIQLVGAENEDDRLMRTTRWITDYLKNDQYNDQHEETAHPEAI